MAYFEHFPYTNFHDINLDRMIDLMEQFRTELKDFVNLNTVKYADPFDWDITTQYPTNTIVMDPSTGVAYISVRPVPAGAPITDTSYWTPVFDLTALFEGIKDSIAAVVEQSTSATVSSPTGTLIWVGNTLYEAQVPITAGDTYRPGGNVEHVTIEELLNRLKAEQTAQAQALEDETAAREEADTLINNAISAETEAREAADANLLETVENMKFPHYHATEHLDLYVTNYVSHGTGDYFIWNFDGHAFQVPEGSDSNPGTSPTKPLKTFKRAMDIMAENAAGAYIYIMGDFNNIHYRVGYPVINAAQLHIMADGTVSERSGRQENGAPVLIWGSTGAAWTLAFYSSYIHMNGTENAPLTFRTECKATDTGGSPITKNTYLEAGKLYASYVNFEHTTNMRLGIIGGFAQLINCTIDRIYVSSGNVVFDGCRFKPNDDNFVSNDFVIQAYNGATVTFTGTTTYTDPSTHVHTKTFMSASACHVDVRISAPNFAGLETGILMNQAYFTGNNARVRSWLNNAGAPSQIYASNINSSMYYASNNSSWYPIISGPMPLVNNEPYANIFYPGEQYSNNMHYTTSGLLTSSGSSLRFTFILPKIIPTGWKINFKKLKLTVRTPAGGYIWNGKDILADSNLKIDKFYEPHAISIWITTNDGSSIGTNNSTITVNPEMTYQVIES